MVSEGSSSFSRSSAWPSLTSSLRSVAAIAIASTGGDGSTVTSAFGAVLPLDSVSPVLTASSLPSATVSPASAEARLVSWAQFTAEMPDTRPLSPDEDCSVAPSSRRPASSARQRQLAAVLQMHGLEHIGQRILGRGHAETLGGLGHAGRFMAQRLHQTQHAVLARGGAEQHRTDQPFAQFAGEIVEHRIARRRNILEQLLHQRVVVIGELFQHREAGFLLAVEIAAFQRHDFGSLVLAIDEGAFQRQIDEAGDQVAVPDRNLPQHQRNPRRRLQGRERLADALVGAIDLVEKQKARNAEILEFAQDDLKLRQLLLVGLADHDRGIDRRQARRACRARTRPNRGNR